MQSPSLYAAGLCTGCPYPTDIPNQKKGWLTQDDVFAGSQAIFSQGFPVELNHEVSVDCVVEVMVSRSLVVAVQTWKW